jgi:hypothetical protein
VLAVVTEVNVYLHAVIFSKRSEENFMEFRKKLAYALLHNTMDEGLAPASRPNTRGSNLSPVHEFLRAPKNAKFEDGEWRTLYKQKTQQHHCATSGCKNRMRTVCICNRSRWMCTRCFADHCFSTGNTNIVDS